MLEIRVCETSSGTSIDESELARKIVYRWDEGMYLHPIMINMQITGGLFNHPTITGLQLHQTSGKLTNSSSVPWLRRWMENCRLKSFVRWR